MKATTADSGSPAGVADGSQKSGGTEERGPKGRGGECGS